MVTVAIAVALLVVLAVVVAVTSHSIWRPWGRRTCRRRGPGARRGPPHRPPLLDVDGQDALDMARAAVEAGASGVDRRARSCRRPPRHRFFACPGATSEVVHERRAVSASAHLPAPPPESTLEIETGADLHVRLLLAEADLPMATLGERLVASDVVVKGASKAADVRAELAAGGQRRLVAAAPEVAADRISVRRIRRIATVFLFVAGVSTCSPR